MRISVDPIPDVWMRTSACWKQRTMKIDEGCLVQMAFRYSMTVSEEDSEAHICEIHVVEINELVTDYPDRKPLLDRRKQPISEDAS